MDLDKLLELSNKCIHSEPPVCVASCPVHMDVIAFLTEIEKGDFKKAYKLMDNKIPLARLIGKICDHPCETVCVRKDAGGSIHISELEKAIIDLGYVSSKKTLSIPKKKGNVAVIGGGISGLVTAMHLDKKGYNVTIFEKSNRLGGRIWDFEGEVLSTVMIEEELQTIEKTGIHITYNREVCETDLEEFMDTFDAVYLGTRDWEKDYAINSDTFQVNNIPLFIGGEVFNKNSSIIFSVSSGKRAGISIDRFISKNSITASREREGIYETRLDYKVDDVISVKPVQREAEIYTEEEAIKEAKRCLKCQCNECIKVCSHMQKYQITPDAYIRNISHNERIILGTHYANGMINSCTECGLCKEQCPVGIGMNDIIHETRESMVCRGKMPLSAHDFALRDMKFSNSESFSFVRKQPSSLCKSSGKTGYLFYPGCQLSATHSMYIGDIYKHIVGMINKNETDQEVGLYLGCCGAPADWAGRQDLMKENSNKIKSVWEEMDHPIFILACSSCSSTFQKYLPMIHTISLWEILDRYGLPEVDIKKEKRVLNIHDACATRHDSNIHESIRNIVKTLGYTIEELEYSKDKTKCCGYGGLVSYANKEQAEAFQNDRIKESNEDILVYCAMCKDSLVRANKRAYHVLDLIYGNETCDASIQQMPTLSKRHNNRKKLKVDLLKELWGEDQDMNLSNNYDFNLNLSNNVVAIMEERCILVDDIKKVIDYSRKKNERFFHTDTSNYLAKLRLEHVTYWVRYEEKGNEIYVNSVYSHRMEVVEE
ncbi:MAG: pyridine nucleotide-disulfide oxidoreductase/dicluster-binding protein [Velocimicrobium sp.]